MSTRRLRPGRSRLTRLRRILRLRRVRRVPYRMLRPLLDLVRASRLQHSSARLTRGRTLRVRRQRLIRRFPRAPTHSRFALWMLRAMSTLPLQRGLSALTRLHRTRAFSPARRQRQTRSRSSPLTRYKPTAGTTNVLLMRAFGRSARRRGRRLCPCQRAHMFSR